MISFNSIDKYFTFFFFSFFQFAPIEVLKLFHLKPHFDTTTIANQARKPLHKITNPNRNHRTKTTTTVEVSVPSRSVTIEHKSQTPIETTQHHHHTVTAKTKNLSTFSATKPTYTTANELANQKPRCTRNWETQSITGHQPKTNPYQTKTQPWIN